MNEQLLISLLTMGGLGLVLSLLLVAAQSRLKVEEDPRVKEIAAVLPELNCAACGFANCQVYAEMVAEGSAPVGSCLVGGKEAQAKIAAIMKVAVEQKQARVAAVRCQGGTRECPRRFRYHGVLTCRANNLINGGDKACVYGCLGYGDCARACPFGALELNDNGLPVVIEKRCTACGLCARACVRNIICLIPQSQQVYLGCCSQDKAKQVREVCAVGCFSCAVCVKAAPDLIAMQDSLPAIKAGQVKDWPAVEQAAAKCPAKCYVLRPPLKLP